MCINKRHGAFFDFSTAVRSLPFSHSPSITHTQTHSVGSSFIMIYDSLSPSTLSVFCTLVLCLYITPSIFSFIIIILLWSIDIYIYKCVYIAKTRTMMMMMLMMATTTTTTTTIAKLYRHISLSFSPSFSFYPIPRHCIHIFLLL